MSSEENKIIENQWTPLEVLGVITRGLLQFILGLIVSVVFLSLLLAYLKEIFEHGEGWHDLDTIEMLFIAVFLALSKRFFSQRVREGISWWETLCRYCHFSVLYHLLAISPLFVVFVAKQSLKLFEDYAELYYLIVTFGYLLVLFAYAPVPRLQQESDDPESSSGVPDEEVQRAS